MLTYNDLVKKRNELENKKDILQSSCESNEKERLSLESELSSLNSSLETNIRTTKELALNDAIGKATLKYENMISKLSNSRDTLLANKQARLDKITYEEYAPLVKNGLSVDDCIEKCNEVQNKLKSHQGLRLYESLSSHAVIPQVDLYSLEDIRETFIELDSKLSKLSNSNSLVSKIMSFSSHIKVENQEDQRLQIASSIGMGLVFIILFLYAIPALVLLLLVLFSYNVYKSYYMYNCLVFVNGIISNLSSIRESIEEGIRTKMEEDRLTIESKFKTKLDKIDANIEKLEDRIVEVTESVNNSFHFDSSRIKDSFLVKEKSLKDRMSMLQTEYLNISGSITEIVEQIKDVNLQIVKLTQSIYEQYYPSEIGNKSPLYPKDMLFSIEDNKPNIFTLPSGSACYVFKDEEVMMDFITLYLTLLYANVACGSFTTHIYDRVYVGTKFINFTSIDNALLLSEQNNVVEDVKELRVEMNKRIGTLSGRTILDYNQEMIKEDSVPLSYHVIVDLFTEGDSLSEEYKQVIINGFDSGIVVNSFILESDIDFNSTNDSGFWKMYDLFKDFYYVNPSGVSKKSKVFFENKRKKR